MGVGVSVGDPVAEEQEHLDRLYARLDQLRARSSRALSDVRRSGAVGTPQNRSERDAMDAFYSGRLSSLNGAEYRLCFGRLDLEPAETRHIGRIGLSDDHQEQLLVDWRAPAAQPFYQATAAHPMSVVRRRHLSTHGRTVTGIEDEIFDLAAIDPTERESLRGEAALMAAVTEARTGRMRDIVATLQAEQDRIVRADLPGILVVQGGPGTGKTAVALHRAAYLLYTYRDRLAGRGVLVVGPSDRFLRYISQVLPSLGETDVVMATPAALYADVEATANEPEHIAALKGDLRMARVIATAVRARQRVPRRVVRMNVDGSTVSLDPSVVHAARRQARASRRPHNVAREIFLVALLDDLVERLAEARGVDVTESRRPVLLEDLRSSRDVRRELNLLWMPVTPQRLLADLYADRRRLDNAARGKLTPEERDLLARERGSAWTQADVPLLDEAARLLGEDDTAARLDEARRAAEHAAELAYAREVQQLSGVPSEVVSAEALAERYAGSGPALSVADRASTDRSWRFGHIVVDEAQELSPMMWRMLLRRGPSGSMTVVGDVSQTGSLAGASTWAEALDQVAPGKWRVEELTVNYRTPERIMALARQVVREAGEALPVTRSVREGEHDPVVLATDPASLVDTVVTRAKTDLAAATDGRVAVVVPVTLLDELLAALQAALGKEIVGDATRDDTPLTVLTPVEAKGLEFDAVIVAEPAALIDADRRGVHDLYVALTRPTQRLSVIHTGKLPAGITA